MRHIKGVPLMKRAALVVLGALILGAFAAPAMASALTPSTIRLTYKGRTLYRLGTAATFTISGRISTAVRGKRMTIEIRKPGRSFWTTVGTPTISRYGTWSMNYFPKLGGSFYIRARYASSSVLSRLAILPVNRGPGRKYVVLLASTTSTQDSGLFDALMPLLHAQMPEYDLQATFVGSGAAIALGGTGDADVLLTHSPAAELDFMKGIVAGQPSAFRGLTRYKVMYNFFMLVGPTANPAGLTMTESAKSAFQKIADSKSLFISRHDNSGTNAKELSIWASLSPTNPQTGASWYLASGTMGMADALAAANNQAAYTLCDSSTWYYLDHFKAYKAIKLLNTGDPADSTYRNQYSVIEVRLAKNAEGAQDFRRWIMSPQVQSAIANYGVVTLKQRLFTADAGSY